jgi:hypothetical protein
LEGCDGWPAAGDVTAAAVAAREAGRRVACGVFLV